MLLVVLRLTTSTQTISRSLPTFKDTTLLEWTRAMETPRAWSVDDALQQGRGRSLAWRPLNFPLWDRLLHHGSSPYT